MIYCVWYPSGGFGHFVNSILNLYGENFVRPKKSFLEFSSDGNSHDLDYVAPGYVKNQDTYCFDFDTQKNYSVIVDNGINDENTNWQEFFPDATIIKLCYSDRTWPVVANTMIHKAMRSSFDSQLDLDIDSWTVDLPWAVREKYFLFLRDHPLRSAWKPDRVSHALMIDSLMNYQTFKQTIEQLQISVKDFDNTWHRWWMANEKYFASVLDAEKFLVGQKSNLTDTWSQAIVYFKIWTTYGVEVPHNDFASFFTDSAACQTWIRQNT